MEYCKRLLFDIMGLPNTPTTCPTTGGFQFGLVFLNYNLRFSKMQFWKLLSSEVVLWTVKNLTFNKGEENHSLRLLKHIF